MGKVCAFFGHRDMRQSITEALEQAVRNAILNYGATEFWCGGYGMFDSMAAGTVKKLSKEHPEIELVLIHAYLPTQGIPEIFDRSIYPEGLETGPRRFAISKRNDWIARNCDMVICCVDHAYGGAWSACKTAVRIGKEVINLGRLNLSDLR